jgi:phosphohistidine phosphatase
MKRLYLVRHAKAGDHSAKHDFERELNERGKEDASQMGKVLSERTFPVDFILTSPASRTLATARAIAHELAFAEDNISSDRRIYNAEEATLLKILQHVDNGYHSIMLVGHNPGITEFANSIFGILITSMATSGVVGGTLQIDSWEELGWGKGKLEFYITPDEF